MLQTILKSAWRQLSRNKSYSFINIMGLVIGMLVAMLSGLWVNHQYQYNRFHEQTDVVYQAMQNYHPTDGAIETDPAVPMPLAKVLREETPGVKYVATTDWGFNSSLIVGEKRLLKSGNYVEPDFLQIFTFPLLQGDKNTALTEPNQIVLTESTASALFGEQNPIGQQVRLDNEHNLQVSGVLADIPGQSTLQFDFLLPYSLKMQTSPWMADERIDWNSFSYQIYFQLEPNADIAGVLEQHQETLSSHSEGSGATFNVHTLADWHLYNTFENGIASNGRIFYVQLFSIIGLLVLLIACINFVNLSTARAEKRNKEIGIRKTVGARKAGLISQFMGEAGLSVFLAFVIALALLFVALPSFNLLVEEQIALPWAEPRFWLTGLALILICTLAAGSYPAIYLLRHSANTALQHSTQGSYAGSNWGQRALVATQFMMSIVLIAGSLIVYQQIAFGEQQDQGYNPDKLISIPYSPGLSKNFDAFSNKLLASEAVNKLTTSSSLLTEISSTTGSIHWPGRADDEQLEIAFLAIGPDYFETLEADMLSGRSFNYQPNADQSAMIVNEAAVRRMGLKAPLATTLNWDGEPAQIVGVVEDMIMENPFEPVVPTVFLKRSWRSSTIVRLNEQMPTADALAMVGEIVENHDPATPFNFAFIEDIYAEKFKEANFMGTISLYFAGLAVFLSVLGLFGLALYLSERRAKEISIRKILGASVSQLWVLLSKEFIQLILLGGLVAVPVGAYLLQSWLGNFTYRIALPWSMFGLAIGIVLLVALALVSTQSLRAAVAKPVDRLRNE